MPQRRGSSATATVTTVPAPVPWAWLGLIALFGAILRSGHILSLRGTPWFAHLAVDPDFYDQWAQRIASGDWIGERPFYMDPLYPYLLACVYRVFGRDLLLARLVNVAFGSVSTILVGALGHRLAGRSTGIVAASAFALYKPEIFHAGEIDKTCLSIALTATLLWFATGRTRRDAALAGVALGLALLTRANLLVFAPLIVLGYWLDRERRAAMRWRADSLAFAAGLTIVLAPVVAHNRVLANEWLFTTTQAGQNFYIGNYNGNPSGAYGTVPFVRGNPQFEEPDFRAEAERRLGRKLAYGELSSYWFRAGLADLLSDPAFALRVMQRKIALFWNDFEIPDSQDQYLLERFCPLMRFPLLGFGGVAAFALFGAIFSFAKSDTARKLTVFSVVYSLSVAAFFVMSRYRIQVVAALIPLSAVGALELARRIRVGQIVPIMQAAASVAVGLVATMTTIGIFSPHNQLFIGMQLHRLGEAYVIAGQPEHALPVFVEAVESCPLHCPGAIEDLATFFESNRRRAEGLQVFRSFFSRYPDHPLAEETLRRLGSIPDS